MRFFVSFNWFLTITMHTLAHTLTCSPLFNHIQFVFLSSHISFALSMLNVLYGLSVRFARVPPIFCRTFYTIYSINVCCCCCFFFCLLFSFRCVFCSIRFVSFCLFLSCVDIYTCFESVCLSHIRVYRRQCVYSHLESPVGTTNDTIFTNITVLSFVSARYRFCFGSQLHYSLFCLYTK